MADAGSRSISRSVAPLLASCRRGAPFCVRRVIFVGARWEPQLQSPCGGGGSHGGVRGAAAHGRRRRWWTQSRSAAGISAPERVCARENSRDAVSDVQRRSSYTPGTTRSYAPTLRGGGRATALHRETFRGGVLATTRLCEGRMAPRTTAKWAATWPLASSGAKEGSSRVPRGGAPRRVGTGRPGTIPESAAHRTGVGRSRVVPLASGCAGHERTRRRFYG